LPDIDEAILWQVAFEVTNMSVVHFAVYDPDRFKASQWLE
jgi:hypothetical protein